MTSFTIRLAGTAIKIHGGYLETKEFCRDYLTGDRASMEVTITRKDIEYERERCEYTEMREGSSPVRHTGAYLETLALQRKIAEGMLEYDGLFFHGSAVAMDGNAYLFTAPSGTGKSTHTRLWRQLFGERAVMVNDDKPMLKCREDGIIVYGTPWMGKHRLGANIGAPLKALCILSRDNVNHVAPLTVQEAFPVLLKQSYRSGDPVRMEKALVLLERLVMQTALYRLGCNMEPAAAKTAYEGMQ